LLYTLNNLNYALMKSDSLFRPFFLFAICCAFSVVEFNAPCHTLAQTQSGSSLNSSNQNDDRPVGFRAVTLQGELVPLRQSKPSDRLEPKFQARPKFQTDETANIPPQRPDGRFGSAGELSKQASYRRSQRQDSQTKRSGDDLESLPSLLGGVTDENENIITQRFPDGKPRVIRQVSQDEHGNYYNHGPWEALNQAGQMVAKGTYVRGLMDGQWSRKHESSSSGLFATKPFNLFQGPVN
jgi:hypothetical protein